PYEREADLREMALTLNALPRPNWGVVSLALTPFPATPLHARCVRDRMLERFATDAYEAMLIPSRPGGYLTPRFWLLLNTRILPHISQALGEKLIARGAQDPWAVRTVEQLADYMERTRKVTTWLRAKAPWLYAALERGLTRASRGVPRRQ
ncbi:MAG: hypothetical protein PHR35_14250, partial [Kiritimatiellae bacterium]|nr:hypothetical protein [Kiritimatiellia bacterium]